MTSTTTRTLIYLPHSGIVHYAAPGFDAEQAASPFGETNPLCGARLMSPVHVVAEVAPYVLCRSCQMAAGEVDDHGRRIPEPSPLVQRLTALLDAVDAGAMTALRETTTDGLLTSYAALTHRIHAAQEEDVTRRQQGHLADLRAQRDLIRAEILRRTGDI